MKFIVFVFSIFFFGFNSSLDKLLLLASLLFNLIIVRRLLLRPVGGVLGVVVCSVAVDVATINDVPSVKKKKKKMCVC